MLLLTSKIRDKMYKDRCRILSRIQEKIEEFEFEHNDLNDDAKKEMIEWK